MLFVGADPRQREVSERCQYTVSRRVISPHSCLTPLAVLKWLEINCCLLILIVIAPYAYTWWAYKYICAAAIFCLIGTILTLSVFFFQLNHGTLEFLPWRFIEICFDALALILFIFALTMGIYDCVQLSLGSQAHHSQKIYESTDLSIREIIMTILVAANCLLYFLSAFHASRAYL